jgi:hypothetical protein
MSVGNALAFIRRVRAEPDLRRRLPDGPSKDGVAALCQVASAEGLYCEPAHLHEAFWIEWAARLAHFSRRTAPSAGKGQGSGASNDD